MAQNEVLLLPLLANVARYIYNVGRYIRFQDDKFSSAKQTVLHGQISGNYSIPPGADTDYPEGEEPADDDDAPKMPGFPYYKGLSYRPAHDNPESMPDIPFPGAKVRPPSLKDKKYTDVMLDQP
eukprot:scaffold401660_cov40-Prasinocladus_malaysianus.AAC.1